MDETKLGSIKSSKRTGTRTVTLIETCYCLEVTSILYSLNKSDFQLKTYCTIFCSAELRKSWVLTLSLQGRNSDAHWSKQTGLQTTNSAPKTYQFNEVNGPDIWQASFAICNGSRFYHFQASVDLIL